MLLMQYTLIGIYRGDGNLCIKCCWQTMKYWT